MVERKGTAKTIEVYPIEDININLYICNGNSMVIKYGWL